LEEVAGRELAGAVRLAGEGAALGPVEVLRGEEVRTIAVIVGPAGRARRFVVLEDLSGIASMDRRRRDFVANASHELQTPIAALVGMLELLEDSEGEYAENLLRRCQKKVEALSVLTRDLIGLARAQDENWIPAARSLDVGQVCQGVVEVQRESALAKGLELNVEVSAGLELIADPVMLETCLANLVQNGIWYTDSGGVVVRGSVREGGGALLEVADTGVGIAPEILPRIFERFFRGDPARSRASGGSGLGLAIVRNLVGRMGGRVAVTSRVGEGTCFQVELPADPAHPLEGAALGSLEIAQE
jgi:signal transduction histidine kinase